MSRSLRLLTCSLVLWVAACNEKNSEYCQGHPNDTVNCPPDAGSACTQDDQCSGKVCDMTSGACVECTPQKAAACTGTKPVCGSDDMCGACTAHSQCTASDVCLPDGSCSDGTNVAYVDPTGSGTECSKTAPCSSVANALATNRPYVKFHGTTSEAVSLNNRNVTFLADPGAKLTEATVGVALEVKGSSQVTVHDLTITDGLANGIGVSMPNPNTANVTLARVSIVNNAGGGISASGGTLTVTQSTVSGNAGGGISISSAQFTITNTFVASNGSGTSGFGGVKIDGITTAGTHVFDFNTVSANLGPGTVNTGVSCGTVTVPVAFSNSIIYGNIVAGGGQQFGGSANCTATYSDIGPDATTGTGNINLDPMFVSPTQSDFHITAASPCKDAADPAATLAVDFDGDQRPQGPHSDVGADEYK